jgi:nickel-dependent lactate racemase
MGGNDIAQNTVHGCTIFSAKDSFQKMTGIIEGNELRADIEDIAKTVGLDAVINVVTTASRGTAGVFVGDMIQAHRAGV